MKFDLNNKKEKQEAIEYFNKLLHQNSLVDITKKFNKRTYSQNNYLHLLLSYCALQLGETLEYFKQIIWKQLIAPDVFKTTYKNYKSGKEREDWKSSADITTKEMSIAIDKLVDWAYVELDIKLPTSNDIVELRKMENEIEIHRKYLQ